MSDFKCRPEKRPSWLKFYVFSCLSRQIPKSYDILDMTTILGISWGDEQLLAFLEEYSFMVLVSRTSIPCTGNRKLCYYFVKNSVFFLCTVIMNLWWRVFILDVHFRGRRLIHLTLFSWVRHSSVCSHSEVLAHNFPQEIFNCAAQTKQVSENIILVSTLRHDWQTLESSVNRETLVIRVIHEPFSPFVLSGLHDPWDIHMCVQWGLLLGSNCLCTHCFFCSFQKSELCNF